MKNWLWVIVLAALGWGVYSQIQAAEAKGEAQELDKQVSEQVSKLDSVSKQKAALDSLVARQHRALLAERRQSEALADSLDSQATEATQTAAQAGEDVDETVDSLRVSVREVLVPLVDTLASQVQAERDAHESVASKLRRQVEITQNIVTQADSSAALCRRARTACEEQVRELEVLVERTTEARDRWREAASPGFLDGFLNALPQVATGVAIGILAGVVIR